MEYLYSQINTNTSQNFYNFPKNKDLNKKYNSSNKKNYYKEEISFKNNSPKYQNIRTNFNTLDIVNKDKITINNSHKEIEESNDLIISNFKINDKDSLKQEKRKRNLRRNNDKKLKNRINHTNNLNKHKNKKLSHSLKKLLERTAQKNQNNNNLIINGFSKNKSSNLYINIIKKNNDNNNNLININKTLFNNLTERNIKINNLIKENNILKSKINNYLLEECHCKMKNDNLYYEKYNELEKSFILLKKSVNDYQSQNLELKKEINILKDNNKENLKDNLFPIKVNIKEYNRNSYCRKNNSLDLIVKENNKLLNENNYYKNQLKERIKKIKDLLIIIENKDIYIKLLKNNINDEKNNVNNEGKDKRINSTEIRKKKYINNIEKTNFNNKSVDKLILENEGNKKKINQILSKIQVLEKIEKENKNYLNINLMKKQLNKNETPPRNKITVKNHYNGYQIEKNEIIILNNKYYRNIIKNNFSIQKYEIIIQNNISKNEIKYNYQIQKMELKIIDNNDKNLIIDDKRFKLVIINNNEIKYISKDNENKGKIIKNENGIQYKIIKENIINYIINNENRDNRFSSVLEEKKNSKKKNKEDFSNNKISSLIKEDFENEKKEIEDKEKRNINHKSKEKRKIKILEGIEVTEINTYKPVRMQSSLSFTSNDINNKFLYLFGLHKDKNILKFDLINKKWLKQIKILNIEDLSETFQNNYIYENSIIYNVLNGFLILTGKNTNILYYFNAINETIFNVCQFNECHNEGNMLLDRKYNRLFVFGGKNSKICEYYSFNDKKIYLIPELNSNRMNSSFAMHKNKIYCFFGYSHMNKKFINTIEYIDIEKLDKWNIILMKDYHKYCFKNLATITFKEEPKYIYLYCGDKISENKDKMFEENLIKFDTEKNIIELVNNFNFIQYKFIGYKWRTCDISTNKNEKTFVFENTTDFIEFPIIENNIIENNISNEFVTNFDFVNTKVLIDKYNNIHYFFYNSKNIEIFRSYYK